MREAVFRRVLESFASSHRRRWMQSAALSLIAASAVATATERSPLVMHETMSEAERAEVIRAAIAAASARPVTSSEHKMLRMSPAESRAELAQVGKESASTQQKSLRDRAIREVRNGETVTLVTGTALAIQSRLIRDANGQWHRTCSEDHGHGAHEHTHLVSKKGSNRE
jgi:peptidyl-tRNA hydrolase